MGFGHIPDLPEHVDEDLAKRHVGQLLGAATVKLPALLDYSRLLDAVPDQGSSSSCVGQAFATALYLRAQLAGTPIPRPSAKAIYDVARLADDPRGAMRDVGSRPRAAIDGLMSYGMVAASRWPLTSSNIDEPPPLDVWQHGLAAMLGGHYRIASGAGAAALVRLALAMGFIPAFAMDVDAAYCVLEPDAVYDGASGPSLGGHMQAFVGFEPGRLIVAGSWGDGFARHGFARVTDNFVDRECSDIIVPTVLPLRGIS